MKLAAAVAAECPSLRVAGVMTIGAPGDLTCFDQLAACRVAVAEAIGVAEGAPPPSPAGCVARVLLERTSTLPPEG